MISIVAGGYNEKKYLYSFFNSIYKQTCPDISEVIYVDNGSTDGSAGYVRQYFPHVRLIQMGANVGFCRQFNRGIREAKGKYVFITNVDMVLRDTYVENALLAMRKDPAIGRISGKSFFMKEDGSFTDIIDSAGHSIDKMRWHKNIGDSQRDDARFDKEGYIFGVCGALGFYKKEMLEDIAIDGQYFDQTFFQTIEDVDLDWRAQLQGWKCYYTPKAVAYHVRKGSGWDKKKTFMYHNYKNRYLLILKNDSLRHVLQCFHWIIFYELKHFYYFWKYPSHRFDRQPLIKGIFGSFLHLGEAFKKRLIIQSKRKVSFKYLTSLFEEPPKIEWRDLW